MYTAIAILIVIASIFLTIIVLVQNSKGGGLAANFAAGNQTFGVRQTADFLEKSTWALALIIIVLCVLATAFAAKRGDSINAELKNKIENTNNATQPQFPVDAAKPSTQPATQPASQPQEQPASEGVPTK
jgi:preprotein translocase subunit SecG